MLSAKSRVALVVLLCLPMIGAAQSIPSARQIGEINALFAEFDHDGSPGYALGVVKDGALVFERGYGRADLDNNVPITPRTSFHLASLSKQFTAAAVALLILDGKLSLDTPVANYFPKLKSYGADIEVKHLLYFTSGLPDYTTVSRVSKDPWFSFYYFTTDEAIVATLRAGKIKFPPGTQWDYSNVNYMMLAKIVERASNESLSEFLATRVFAPLQMSDSELNDDSTLIIANRATGYADRSDPSVLKDLQSVGIFVRPGPGFLRLPRISPHYGGSGVFSTIEDLAKWDASFYSNKLAGARFTQLMLRREKFSHDKDNDALGLVFGDFDGRQMLWFSGDDLDSSTFMARLPQEHLTVICLSNMPRGHAEDKARAVLSIMLNSNGDSGAAQPTRP
jgi:CubicO group peptidase (beta-lactamase class C family)